MTRIRLTHDLKEILQWRRRVVAAVFGREPNESLIDANAAYLEHTGTYDFYVAEMDGEAVGCGAVCYSREMPSPGNPSGRNGFLVNIFVTDDVAGRGVARAIVGALVERARFKGCDKIFLEATPVAREICDDIRFRNFDGLMVLG